MQNNFNYIILKAADNLQNNISFVLATVLKSIGGTPCRSGFKMIVYPDKSSEGTVGGGLIEQSVIAEALKLFDTRQNKLLFFDLTEDSKNQTNSPPQNVNLNMQCGGSANIFLECFPPARSVYLFGAGHLCQSILPLLNSLDFHTVVIDNRSEYADPKRLTKANQVIHQDYKKYAQSFSPAYQDALIIFTHDHTNDYDILLSICQRSLNCTYIGMIASKQKANQNLQKLLSLGIPKHLIQNIHTPIGLNIAKTTTSEIAISITAELLATYNNITDIHPLSKSPQ
jgi:xanthine dehydrogenase accessory factor